MFFKRYPKHETFEGVLNAFINNSTYITAETLRNEAKMRIASICAIKPKLKRHEEMKLEDALINRLSSIALWAHGFMKGEFKKRETVAQLKAVFEEYKKAVASLEELHRIALIKRWCREEYISIERLERVVK